MPAFNMSHFDIGFLEEFVLLVLSGTFLGLCLFASTRFLVKWARGKVSFGAAAGPILLLALLFFFINIPRIRAAALEGLPYFLGMGLVSMLVISWVSRGRGFVSKGFSGLVFVSACAVLLTFSIFQFVTARHTSLREGELVALIEVTPTELPPGHEIENDAVLVRYKGNRPVPAIDIELLYYEDGKAAPPLSITLPGEKWGIGGELMHVRNWFWLFGDRTFCRLTGVDAKFNDLETASVGYNLPGYDPDTEREPLETQVPIVNRKLRELCNVETVSLSFEQFVYQPVEAGSYFAIYLQPGGGFVPKPISPEEFAEIRRTEFIEPLAEIL